MLVAETVAHSHNLLKTSFYIHDRGGGEAYGLKSGI